MKGKDQEGGYGKNGRKRGDNEDDGGKHDEWI